MTPHSQQKDASSIFLIAFWASLCEYFNTVKRWSLEEIVDMSQIGQKRPIQVDATTTSEDKLSLLVAEDKTVYRNGVFINLFVISLMLIVTIIWFI